MLVTNADLPLSTLAQACRDRADCENVFDEIKNQWGWAGFVTQDLRRCRIMARLIALVYNWWNVFTRLAQPDRHLEAIWAIISSVAFRLWLREKPLCPVVEGSQTLLLLTSQATGSQNKNSSVTRSGTELLFPG